MDYSIEFKVEAIASLEKLDPIIQQRALNKIKWLGTNFDQLTPQPLTDELSGLFKLRIGDYRAIYSFSINTKTVVIHDIGHRSQIYR
jgi:mRNA interferase RelE/StbE